MQGAASSDAGWSHGRRAAIVVVQFPTMPSVRRRCASRRCGYISLRGHPRAILLAAYLQQGLSEGKAGRETFHAHAAIVGVVTRCEIVSGGTICQVNCQVKHISFVQTK